MKRLFLFALLALATTTASAQYLKPYFSSLESYCQMWNPASSYYGTPTCTNTTCNLGNQKDTTSGTTTLYLGICGYNVFTPVVAADTFTYKATEGYGVISFYARAYKVTGTDTVTFTLESSLDGVGWGPAEGTSPVVLYPTSLTVPAESHLYCSVKHDRFYRWAVVGNAGTTICVQGWYHYQVIVQKNQ